MSALAGPFHLVSLVLVVSGMQKVLAPAAAAQAMRSAKLPLVASTTGGFLLGVGEVGVGVAGVSFGNRAVAVVVAAAYLALAAFVVLLRRRDATASCGCFGASSTPPGNAHVVLNIGAAAIAVAAAAVGVPDLLAVGDEGAVVATLYGAVLATGVLVLLTAPAAHASLRREVAP